MTRPATLLARFPFLLLGLGVGCDGPTPYPAADATSLAQLVARADRAPFDAALIFGTGGGEGVAGGGRADAEVAFPIAGGDLPVGTSGAVCAGAHPVCNAGLECVPDLGVMGHCRPRGSMGTTCGTGAAEVHCAAGLACAFDDDQYRTGICRTAGSHGTPCDAHRATGCASAFRCVASVAGLGHCRRPGEIETECDGGPDPARRCARGLTCWLHRRALGRCVVRDDRGGPCGAGICPRGSVCCDPAAGPCVPLPNPVCP